MCVCSYAYILGHIADLMELRGFAEGSQRCSNVPMWLGLQGGPHRSHEKIPSLMCYQYIYIYNYIHIYIYIHIDSRSSGTFSYPLIAANW